MIDWKSVEKDGLPTESCTVLVYISSGTIMNVSYSSKHKLFNTRDNNTDECANRYRINARHWAMPNYPEEVE